MKVVLLSIVLVVVACSLLHWVSIQSVAMAEPRPPNPQLPPASPDLELNQLTINNKMNLFGDSWAVLNLQPAVAGTRAEFRLFPRRGAGPLADVGGEITLSNQDLYRLDSTGDYHVLAIYAYKDEYRIQSQAGGKATPYPIKFDSMGGLINLTLNTNGSLGIARGISNTEGAGGFAHTRVASCSGPSCQLQVTWATSFGDSNYTATCTLGGALGFVSWEQKEASYLVVDVVHAGNSDGGEVDCVGVHD